MILGFKVKMMIYLKFLKTKSYKNTYTPDQFITLVKVLNNYNLFTKSFNE